MKDFLNFCLVLAIVGLSLTSHAEGVCENTSNRFKVTKASISLGLVTVLRVWENCIETDDGDEERKTFKFTALYDYHGVLREVFTRDKHRDTLRRLLKLSIQVQDETKLRDYLAQGGFKLLRRSPQSPNTLCKAQAIVQGADSMNGGSAPISLSIKHQSKELFTQKLADAEGSPDFDLKIWWGAQGAVLLLSSAVIDGPVMPDEQDDPPTREVESLHFVSLKKNPQLKMCWGTIK